VGVTIYPECGFRKLQRNMAVGFCFIRVIDDIWHDDFDFLRIF
jgi:hypothetical protein